MDCNCNMLQGFCSILKYMWILHGFCTNMFLALLAPPGPPGLFWPSSGPHGLMGMGLPGSSCPLLPFLASPDPPVSPHQNKEQLF